MEKKVRKDILFGIAVELLFFSTPLTMTYLPNLENVTACFQETSGLRGILSAIPFWLTEMGLSTLAVCQFYILAMNLLTCVFAWSAFSRISGNPYAGLAGSLCYSLSVYSMFIRYEAGALGELTAYAFMPLVVRGLYVLMAAVLGKHKDQKKEWSGGVLAVVIGTAGVFCSGIPVLPDNVLLYRVWPLASALWGLAVCLTGGYVYRRKKRYAPIFMAAVIVWNIFGGMYYMNRLLYYPEGKGIL